MSTCEERVHAIHFSTYITTSHPCRSNTLYCLTAELRGYDIICLRCMQYLILPGDGDTACDKLVVEVVVCGVKVHAFDSGELLDVQDVFTVHGPRLRDTGTHREREKDRDK